MIRLRCPQCESTWVGHPVPDLSVVVRDDDGRLTIANSIDGTFIEAVDQVPSICLDCRHRWEARP